MNSDRAWVDTEMIMPPNRKPIEVMDEVGVVRGARFDNGIFYFDHGEGSGLPIVYWRLK